MPDFDPENFDADRAQKLVTNLRDEIRQLKADKATLSSERDAALADVAKAQKTISEQQATIDMVDGTAKEHESKLAEISALRTKEGLLADAGLPRKFAAQVVGDDEKAWQDSVSALLELRGDAAKKPSTPRQDPAQESGPAVDDKDAVATAFFDQMLGS